VNRSSLILIAVLAVVFAAAFTGSSRATSPGTNGRIAYMAKDRAGHWQQTARPRAGATTARAPRRGHGRCCQPVRRRDSVAPVTRVAATAPA
jgi:hypothetical protein